MNRDEIYARWLRKLVLDREPTLLSAVVVVVGTVLVALAVRLTIERTGGTVVPFLMTYPATMLAVLLVGPRPALLVAATGLILNIQHVLPRWHPGRPILTVDTVANVAITALSLTLIIWITSAFRRATIRLRDHSQREIETLGLLIEEADHRTKNNFQIAAILLDRTAQADQSEETLASIRVARNRLLTIAKSYQNLITSDKNARVAPLNEHIQRIVTSFEAGLLPENVTITVRAEPVILDQQCNLVVGLIVGEWVTNAIKYAFGDGAGHILVSATRRRADVIIIVSDNGQAAGEVCAGTGSRLVYNLARTIGATVETDFQSGTRCSLVLPIAD